MDELLDACSGNVLNGIARTMIPVVEFTPKNRESIQYVL
jgi:hypothetical protein